MAQTSDMYRCMLNKRTEAPTAVQVPLDRYPGSLESRYTGRLYVRRATPQPHDDPPNAFVLFHQDLRTSCMERGVLCDSQAQAMWRVVARNIETYDPNAESETEAAAATVPPR